MNNISNQIRMVSGMPLHQIINARKIAQGQRKEFSLLLWLRAAKPWTSSKPVSLKDLQRSICLIITDYGKKA